MRTIIAVIAVLATLCLATAYGQDDWDLRIIGGVFTPGQAQAVANYNHYALVADTERGLRIYDVSTPTWPVSVANYINGGWVNDVIVRDDRAYLANWNNGVTILDITFPTIPLELDNYNTSGTTSDIYLADSLLYAADLFNGLVILDVADPENIVQVGHISAMSFNSVAVDDTVIYIADLGTGLQIYSLADTTNPSFKAFRPLATDCNDILLHGDYMYLSCGQAGMLVYDITDRLNPVSLTSYNTNGSLNRIAIADTIAYLADSEAGLTALNISNPANPSLIQTLNTPGSAKGVAFYLDFTLVADGNMFLVIYHEEYVGIDDVNVTVPSDFRIVNCYPNPFNSSTVINFSIQCGSQISLDVYDINGRFITGLADGYYESGEHSVEWNASGISTGIYFIKISDTGAGNSSSNSTVARVLYLK